MCAKAEIRDSSERIVFKPLRRTYSAQRRMKEQMNSVTSFLRFSTSSVAVSFVS